MDESYEFAKEILWGLVKKLEYLREKQAIKTKNEVILNFNKLSLASEPEFITCEILPLGNVLHFTEGFLLVSRSPQAPLLELDTKACTENFLVIGHIDDIIGSIENPTYSILAYQKVAPGTLLYYPITSPILSSLSHKRGTDASNNNDEETSEESSGEEPAAKTVKAKRKKAFKILQQPPPFE